MTQPNTPETPGARGQPTLLGIPLLMLWPRILHRRTTGHYRNGTLVRASGREAESEDEGQAGGNHIQL